MTERPSCHTSKVARTRSPFGLYQYPSHKRPLARLVHMPRQQPTSCISHASPSGSPKVRMPCHRPAFRSGGMVESPKAVVVRTAERPSSGPKLRIPTYRINAANRNWLHTQVEAATHIDDLWSLDPPWPEMDRQPGTTVSSHSNEPVDRQRARGGECVSSRPALGRRASSFHLADTWRSGCISPSQRFARGLGCSSTGEHPSALRAATERVSSIVAGTGLAFRRPRPPNGGPGNRLSALAKARNSAKRQETRPSLEHVRRQTTLEATPL
jgi:hypothetical protein